MTAAARARTILERFPRHLRLDEPGKLVGAVAESLAAELDGLTSGIGRVRRAHRVRQADSDGDLLRLAALHDLDAGEFELLSLRLEALAALRDQISAEGASEAEVDAALEQLGDLLGIPAASFPPWPEDAGARAPALARLAAALDGLLAYRSELGLMRRHLGEVIDLHRAGNGAVGTLLGATANTLGLELTARTTLAGGDWHLATSRDRFRLVRPEPPGSGPAETLLSPLDDVIALEENPPQLVTAEPVARRHGEWFTILRKGLERAPAAVRVIGSGERTQWPLVVDLDSGQGVAFHGAVADGAELRFELDGRATLDGEDVTPFAYSFHGGVFADRGRSHPNDFIFADAEAESAAERAATYAASDPEDDHFEAATDWPHEGGLFDPLSIALGDSRWAFFVRLARFGSETSPDDESPPRPVPAVPIFDAGMFDGSVWAELADAGAAPSAEVGFEWLQREAFAVCVWLPARFESLDEDGRAPLRERVRTALDRFRAAGVRVGVKYASDKWLLGDGLLRDLDSTSALGLVVRGTRLWPDDTTQPEPE